MSSKSQSTATKEDCEPALVPKLRFPEFRGAEGWKREPIGPHLEGCSGRVPPDTELPIYSSTRDGLKRQDAYFDGKILQNKNEYGVVPPDFIVYRHMSDDGLFRFNINDTGGSVAVSKEYPVFTTKGLNSVFVLAKLNDGPDFKQFALSQKAGGTRTRLYFSRLCEWETLLPSPLEQQKIAECLSSVDEVIAAQAQKLDAQKTRKKGLIQQLFPREGEIQPRLRFPEFQDAGEWETASIQELIDKKFIVGHLDGNHGSLYPRAEEFSETGVPYISVNCFSEGSVDFRKCKFLPQERADQFRKGVARDGDILFAHNATVGPVAKLNTDCDFVILGTSLTYFRCNQRFLVSDFLLCLLVSPAFVDQYTSVMAQSTRNQIPITAQRTFSLQIPRLPEQQRIASCLSSLDQLIVAETQMLEALKTHKRGLMQQLFLSAEEVEA